MAKLFDLLIFVALAVSITEAFLDPGVIRGSDDLPVVVSKSLIPCKWCKKALAMIRETMSSKAGKKYFTDLAMKICHYLPKLPCIRTVIKPIVGKVVDYLVKYIFADTLCTGSFINCQNVTHFKQNDVECLILERVHEQFNADLIEAVAEELCPKLPLAFRLSCRQLSEHRAGVLAHALRNIVEYVDQVVGCPPINGFKVAANVGQSELSFLADDERFLDELVQLIFEINS